VLVVVRVEVFVQYIYARDLGFIVKGVLQ